MTNSVDPVRVGLVASLAHPGQNVTGFSSDTGGEINGKRIGLLKETLPNLSRVGILFNPAVPSARNRLASTQESARALGLTLVPVEARGLDALEQAFAKMVGEQMQAFFILGDSVLFNCRGQIAEMALKHRLPAAGGGPEWPGLLLSYGSDLRDLFRRTAVFVDKIFKGAKPADLPVEQPIKFDLVVNLKTAKAIGVGVPLSVQQRADEVIE
jgi:putative ABC transport system substrate-binding protein